MAPTGSVSVALCTHNGERFVGAQLDSIFAQTVVPVELVVSDDASTDSTLDIVVERHAAHSAAGGSVALRILRNTQPLGVTGNFERAILACSSELIALSDQDDVWRSDRLERSLESFERGADVLLVHSDARLVDAAGTVVHPSLLDALEVSTEARRAIVSGDAFALLLHRNLMTGATMCIRRSLAQTAAPFPPGWVHDEWLAIIASAVGRIDLVQQPLIDYRQHGGNEIGAADLSLRVKLGRLVEPGADRNRRLLQRARSLAERLPLIAGVAPSRVEAAARKVLHEEARSALPASRLRRIGPVMREWRTGRYSAFGGGLNDVARDLIQPLKPAS
ncbi:MAG: glycosyltransferase family 2 protein [Rhodoglobus sp.]|nr:glycosyltransferase family 2 protein [Rhodoglobus sp.]